jgi:hypothetical protein
MSYRPNEKVEPHRDTCGKASITKERVAIRHKTADAVPRRGLDALSEVKQRLHVSKEMLVCCKIIRINHASPNRVTAKFTRDGYDSVNQINSSLE